MMPKIIDTPLGPSIQGASATLLAELLDDFQDVMIDAGVPVDQLLRPGTDEQRVRSEFKRIGFEAPDEIVTWLGWHDGYDKSHVSGSRALLQYQFYSLEQIVLAYETLGSPNEHDPGWIRWLGDVNGLALRPMGAPAEAPCIRPNSHVDGPDASKQVVSICTYIVWWTNAIREGWYRWRPETEWDLDTLEPFDR